MQNTPYMSELLVMSGLFVILGLFVMICVHKLILSVCYSYYNYYTLDEDYNCYTCDKTIILNDEYDVFTTIGNDLARFFNNDVNKKKVDDVNCVNRYDMTRLRKRKLSTTITLEIEALLRNKVDLLTFRTLISKINNYLSE
jgi:hypothetical protein